MEWTARFEEEIQNAENARERGNEGQARVCARRAAGVVIREYFLRRNIPLRSTSAYDLIKELLNNHELSAEVRVAADALVLRVNDEFKLPVDIDLIQQSKILAKNLLSAAVD